MTGRLPLTVCAGTPQDWERWVDSSAPTLRQSWLTLAEQRLPGGLLTFHLRDEDALVVGTGGTVLETPGDNPRLDPFWMLSGRSRDVGLLPDGPHPWANRSAGDCYPSLLLMLPNYETTVIGPGRTDVHQLDALLAGIEEWGRSAGLRAVAVSYLLPHPEQVIDALRARDWSVSMMTHRCDMAVTWHDFDGYLATLRSKRRVAVRRELRALDEAGVRLRAVPISAADLDGLVRLRLQLLDKYGLPVDEAKESGTLARLVEHFADEDLTVVEARAGQRLLGYTLLVRDGQTWTALMTGSDYTDPLSVYCYFATCYYEPARRAPHAGVSRISYGMGSWEAKRLRGCTLTPLYIGCRDLVRPQP